MHGMRCQPHSIPDSSSYKIRVPLYAWVHIQSLFFCHPSFHHAPTNKDFSTRWALINHVHVHISRPRNVFMALYSLISHPPPPLRHRPHPHNQATPASCIAYSEVPIYGYDVFIVIILLKRNYCTLINSIITWPAWVGVNLYKNVCMPARNPHKNASHPTQSVDDTPHRSVDDTLRRVRRWDDATHASVDDTPHKCGWHPTQMA